MMRMLWLLLAGLATLTRAEVRVRVSPELVHPGVTPSVSIDCALLEMEEAKIVSLALSRRTGAQGNLQAGPAENLVFLSALNPGVPEVNAAYPGLTVLGQISAVESEFGSYIHLVGPSPTIEDLGLYTCEAVVIEETGMLTTLIGQAWVTTADPMIDRLLLAVQRLEGKLDLFNDTLLDLQAQVDNITAGQVEDVEEVNVTAPVEEVNGTTPTEATIETTTAQPPTSAEEPPVSTLDRLATALDNVNSKLDEFNATITGLSSKLDKLQEKTTEAENKTTAPVEESTYTHVNTFFIHNQSIYFLISTSASFSSQSAQAMCESLNLYLAEITDSSELSLITNSTANLITDQVVLVSGRRGAGTGAFIYQHSSTPVTYFGDVITPETVPSKEPACLALQPQETGLVFVDVSCTEVQPAAFALCEDELAEASGDVDQAL